jgi:ATP-dependent Clp protease ATP-binding subunit ClpA
VRPLRRFIRSELEDPAAELLLSGSLKQGGVLHLGREGEALRVRSEAPAE